MATGDTIPGKVRISREDTEGARLPVAGPFQQDRVDYFNNDVQPDEKLYINTMHSDRVAKPAGAEAVSAQQASFAAGEVLYVEFQANSTVANDIDHDADSFAIDVLTLDRNRDKIFPDTLSVADQELSADPTESATSYVDMFQYTVPDRQEVRVVGAFESVAVEN